MVIVYQAMGHALGAPPQDGMFVVLAIPREGVKTVNGKEIKEAGKDKE